MIALLDTRCCILLTCQLSITILNTELLHKVGVEPNKFADLQYLIAQQDAHLYDKKLN